MSLLYKRHKYHWIDSFGENPVSNFSHAFNTLLSLSKHQNRQPVFLCIGTPDVPGDCLGPAIGTILTSRGFSHIYGTLNHPVHAENLSYYKDVISKNIPDPYVITIDASLGKAHQAGYITLKDGPLYPGKGVGKKLGAIGHLEITGVFESLYGDFTKNLIIHLTTCISNGILVTVPSYRYRQ